MNAPTPQTLDRALGATAMMLERAAQSTSQATPTSHDPLALYMAQLRALEPLQSEAQQALAWRVWREHDHEAARALILTNLRLVVKLAREYHRQGQDILELIQEGNVGLAESVTRYDPTRGIKFTSYAQYWIRAMILNHLMNHLHPVRIGGSRAGRKLFYNLKKARHALIQQGHVNPSPALIAQVLEVDVKEVILISAQLDGPAVSMDASAPGHERATVGELMDSGAPDPEQLSAELELDAHLSGLMEAFAAGLDNPRDQAIWRERLLASEPKSLVEIGRQWGISKERVRQLEERIKGHFKAYFLEQPADLQLAYLG